MDNILTPPTREESSLQSLWLRLQRPARGGNTKDALIATVIVAVVIIFVYGLGSFLWEMYQVSATQTEMTTMLENARKLKSRKGYDGASMATLRSVGGIPPSIDRSGDTYYNRWSGTISLAAAKANSSSTNNAVALTYTNVPEGACGDISQMFLNAGQSIYSVSIDGKALLVSSVTSGSSTAATLIGSQCDDGDKTLVITTAR